MREGERKRTRTRDEVLENDEMLLHRETHLHHFARGRQKSRTRERCLRRASRRRARRLVELREPLQVDAAAFARGRRRARRWLLSCKYVM